MGKFIGITLLFWLFSSAAVAADFPKAEVFGGYQYTRFEGGVNANGWNAALTGNLNHWFGVTADFSGAYKSENGVDFKNYTYTFGPVVSMLQSGSFTPFAHALFGGFHASASFGGFSGSVNGFASLIGGGVDIKVTPQVAVRAVQVDWLLAHAEGATSKSNARISTGLVLRF
jgi:hypothetical protein